MQGGWAQVSFKPGKFGFYVGAGSDNPLAPESLALAKGAIFRNFSVYASATYTFANRLVAGFEYDRLQTGRVDAPEAVNNHLDLTVQFGF